MKKMMMKKYLKVDTLIRLHTWNDSDPRTAQDVHPTRSVWLSEVSRKGLRVFYRLVISRETQETILHKQQMIIYKTKKRSQVNGEFLFCCELYHICSPIDLYTEFPFYIFEF